MQFRRSVFAEKMSTAFLLVMSIYSFSFAYDWQSTYYDQNRFVKIMYMDPTFADRSDVVYNGVSAPDPAPSHYWDLNDIGINALLSAIQVSGEECTQVFIPGINQPQFPAILSVSVQDPQGAWKVSGDNLNCPAGYLDYYCNAIAIKKRLSEWNYTGQVPELNHPVRPLEANNKGTPYYGDWFTDVKAGVDIIRGRQFYNAGMTEQLFGGTYIPNFYGSGNDFNSRLCERLNGWAENSLDHPVKIRLKLRLEDYTPGTPENPSLPTSSDILFKVKIWESDMSGPNSSAESDVIYSYSINSLCDTIFQIPPPPPEQKRYNLEDYNWLQLPTVNYNSLQDGERRQLNIQFYIRNTSYLTDSYHVSILIDEIEVFDAAGEEIIKP